MGKISILSKETAQLIAAGEVVDRPASIVKEFVENAVDAGAKNIVIEIKNGGTTYIRVEDDGDGFLYDDIKPAFIRHATSKIKSADDLDNIVTLGFRGEALPSIACVSKLQVITKNKDSEIGKIFVIHGNEEVEFSDIGCKDGTTFVVEDIFFNTPARLKFLKKDVTEGNVVSGIIDRIALSYPDISFTFIKDGKICLKTPRDNKLVSTMSAVFNKNNINEEYFEIRGSDQRIDIYGYISTPTCTRANRSMQYFYINGRFIKSQILSVAFERAYKNLIMTGKYPSCVLNINMSPNLFDINVHPSKIEVRFFDEKKVFSILYSSIKSALLVRGKEVEKNIVFNQTNMLEVYDKNVEEHNITNSFRTDILKSAPDNDTLSMSSDILLESYGSGGDTPIYDDKNISISNNDKMNFITSKKGINIYYDEEIFASDNVENGNIEVDDKILKECVNIEDISRQEDVQITYDNGLCNNFSIIGEIFGTYVIFRKGDDVFFLDKHAGHERLIYEKVKAGIITQSESQSLMEPSVLNLTKIEYDAVLDNLELLKKSGFIVEDFGDGTIIVNEIPTYLIDQNIKDIFMEIADNLSKNIGNVDFFKLEWLCESIACRSAIKAHDKNSKLELEKLIGDIYKYDIIKYCPHGRPIMVKLTKGSIEKIFGR